MTGLRQQLLEYGEETRSNTSQVCHTPLSLCDMISFHLKWLALIPERLLIENHALASLVNDMNSCRRQIHSHSRDDTSSIYSRSPETAKDAKPKAVTANILPIQKSYQEINSLDHQIAMSGGSTMALESTRSRLKISKEQPKLSLLKLKKERLQQRDQQERENDFYRNCFKNFHQLVSSVMDSTQSLALQYHFNTGEGPSGDPRLIRTMVLIRVALDKSRAEEAQAEQEWKQQWNVHSARKSATRWL
ncbi:hypothetical protein N7510_002670 [Penicillium lagena]|uniref:uncharacterized protein n=1 Tax=Penicillium lagena TaxID=94218 RepID=UPI0025416949|nr:uncharacterized protein N7510_002670 [Penicillium lagena]KAJ5626361.1 hypothetical protein N7510_002670 [Penicillium lagena]